MQATTENIEEEIYYSLEDYKPELRQAFLKPYGIAAWFKAYKESIYYQELNLELKTESLETFVGLNAFLSVVTNEQILSDYAEENIKILTLNLKLHKKALYNSHARNFGLSAWFKSYLISDAFQQLSYKNKGEAVDTHTMLCVFLTETYNYP
jgi:hypothetical protein